MEIFFLQAALVVLTLFLSIHRGSCEHRVAALAIAANFGFGAAFALTMGRASDWNGIPTHRVIIDTVTLLVFLRVWMGSNNWWVLWISSAQLLSVLAHTARILSLPLPALGYAVMEMWPFWLIIVVTMVSAVRNSN